LRLQAKGMKDENYITIQGWMINKLNLSGTELIIYAVIYGFSQDEGSVFDGSIKYLEKATGKKRTAVITNLKSLVDKGFLNKAVIKKKGVTFNQYVATVPPVRKTYHPRTENVPPPYGKRTTPRTENVPNNIDNTIVDNIDNTIEVKSKRFSPPSFVELSDYFFEKLQSKEVAKLEAEKFNDFYASKNWMVGKNKMKEWKAAVRNWLRRKNEGNGKQGKGKDLFSQESIKERLASW
jgi:hypothetical protein